MNNSNKISNFSIVIASVPDREQVVANLFFGREEWVEISQEDKQRPLLVMFPCSAMPSDEAILTLVSGRNKLLQVSFQESYSWINIPLQKFEISSNLHIGDSSISILFMGKNWAKLIQEEGALYLYILTPGQEEYWELPCDEAMTALIIARNRLLGLEDHDLSFLASGNPEN